jgi:hypothetical protein
MHGKEGYLDFVFQFLDTELLNPLFECELEKKKANV